VAGTPIYAVLPKIFGSLARLVARGISRMTARLRRR
jgi:hypothetical protein